MSSAMELLLSKKYLYEREREREREYVRANAACCTPYETNKSREKRKLLLLLLLSSLLHSHTLGLTAKLGSWENAQPLPNKFQKQQW